MAKFYYVRRSDGKVLDIPQKHLDQTVRQNPTWKVLGEVNTDVVASEINNFESQATKDTEVALNTPEVFTCPLCPYQATKPQALRMHKTRAHK